ncbi:MAG: zinc ABC transporter solute-binding protein, partial [Tissierellia bacterium]|nr:zinc ABC transporter solute-binding protein [Tissierellia bacterium]
MKKIGLGLLLLLVFITGCSQSNANETAKEGDRLQVVASFYPIADFTERIGGDRVEVETLIGSGVDPHGWEMSTTDRNKVERADLFIYNGAGFEHWVDDLLDGLENKDLQIVEAAERVALMEGHSHDHDDHDDHDHEEEA